MATVKKTFCRICEPNCPMNAEVDEKGKVIALKPNPDHPSGGIACHKGLSFLDIHNDPDRLNWPLKRSNSKSDDHGEFERVDWDTALDECADKLEKIREEHGPNSVAIYVGNPLVANSRLTLYYDAFNRALGTRMKFSAASQDMTNKVLGSIAMHGTQVFTVPDIANTDYLLCLGSNPKTSKWTIMSVPNDSGDALKNIRARGGKVCFVNPRVTESSTPETGETLQIKPDTDVYFLAALMCEVERLGGFDQRVIDQHANRFEQLLAFVHQYPAEKVTGVTGLAVEHIREVANDIIAADTAAFYLSTGVNQGRQGLLSYWLLEMLSLATGNLGKKGGSYAPHGFLDNFKPIDLKAQTVETSLGPMTFPNPMGYTVMPGALMSDFMLNGDIKALINISGNPLFSIGGEDKLRKAFSQLDLLITLDINKNATAELSDYVLPGTDFLERSDVNLFAQGIQMIPYVQLADAVAEPSHERRNDWWIISELTQRMGLAEKKDEGDGYNFINLVLSKIGLSIDKLKADPERTALLKTGDFSDFFDRCVVNPDKKIDCYPAIFEENNLFDRCHRLFDELNSETEDSLKLISLRTPYMHNSWLANVQRLRTSAHTINPLNMCAKDAAAKGLLDGDKIRVFNDHGSVETELRINNDLRPGAAAMTHGYGRGRRGMTVAETHPGANYNRLLPSGPEAFEPLSHMSWMVGIPIEVEKA